MPFRKEVDRIGTMDIPEDAYYGIHSLRSKINFPLGDKKINTELIDSLIIIKKAAAIVNGKLKLIPKNISEAIVKACNELLSKGDYSHFIPHPLQGGAGTSANMNVNEVIANKSIEILGGIKGDYTLVHPINHVNCSQSTNDVYPTAIKIASIMKIRKLAEALAQLQETLQKKECEFSDILKLGRTQLNDALPITLGQEFGAFARCISRDRWRIYKVEERLREVNIGGTAIGTGLNAPLEYIYGITETLQRLTGLGLSRSDLLIDTTQNMDVFVEVSGLLKACVVNLIKISNDIRLMASGPKGGLGEIFIESRQNGSSIMPDKINPVMCEMMIQISYKVIGNDAAITACAFSGQLELNPFTPLIADCLLDSLDMLTMGIPAFNEYCIKTIQADKVKCRQLLEGSYSLSAALIHHIGYERAEKISLEAKEKNKTIKEILLENNIFTKQELEEILNVYQLTKPGIPGRSNIY